MQQEKWKDVALGGFVVGIALAGFVFVNPTDAPVVAQAGGMSWRTLPYIYSGLLLFLACLFIGTTILHGPVPVEDHSTEQEQTDTGNDAEDGRILTQSMIRRLLVVVLLIVYSQLLRSFGFAISTPIFLFAIQLTFGNRNLGKIVAVSVIGGGVLWVLFAHLLHMPLRGDLWDPVSPFLTHVLNAIGI